ncbi:M protein, serotype 6-like [Pecten maximus]|uniref:M protein, serotype 6-like n=1 Tax=Pecten maximus TaxID=6579 RepID=UPI00145848F2|nr:M protein, serotype 6-like [Pecten maximus]
MYPQENLSHGGAARGGKSKNKKRNKKKKSQQDLEGPKDDNKSLRKENKSLRDENRTILDQNKRLQDENKRHHDEKTLLTQELTNINTQLTDCRQQCDQLRGQNEDMLQRYSQVLSNQIMNNNPSIQDLNYRDQPRQIAETFRAELYNKQWGDAFDVLDTKLPSERDQLEILRDLCRYLYTFPTVFEDLNATFIVLLFFAVRKSSAACILSSLN